MKSTIAAIAILSSAIALVSAHEDSWGGWGWWPAPEPEPESGKSGKGKGSSGKSGKGESESEPEPWGGAWDGGDVWNGGWEGDGWGWAAPEPEEGKSGKGSGKSGKGEEEESDDAGWGWGHTSWGGWGAWPESEPEGKSGKGSKGSGKSGKGEGEEGGHWVFVPAWPTDDGWSAPESEGKSGKGSSGKSGKGSSGKSGKGEEPEPWAAPADETTTYIISFKDKGQSPAKRCEALAKSNRGTVKYVYEHVLNGCALSVPVGDAPAACNAFKNHPTVSMVEEDQLMSLDDPIEEHMLDYTHRMLQVQVPSWGLDRINQCARPLDNVVTKQDASDVTVFIIDTGIYAAHDEFAGVISLDDCHASFAGGDALNDDNGHGTHVAGTACGANYGVSENCKLCAVKVLDRIGTGSNAGIISGVDYVTGKCKALGGLCVANMSLGGGTNSMINAAVNAAVSAGVVMVVAAGNDNQDACSSSPASEPSAITVGSTMNTDTDARSSFSNWGSCVDVYAPGSDITSSWISSPDATNTISGTSMASPHVAGIAAAIRSANPSWNPTQVRDAIVNSAALLSSGINLAVVDDIDCQPGPVAKADKGSSLRNRHV